MPSVTEHYDHHLGPVYSWMIGDADAAIEQNMDELRQLGIVPGVTGAAIDLGAGPGLHAIPLARLGFAVIAIDTCGPLLQELRERAGALPIRRIQADLSSFRRHHAAPVDAVLCMGDTLTHLPTLAAVETLLDDVAAALSFPGVFVATFRDYRTREPRGEERFLLVRADDTRILTCFLEYAEDVVHVHDLLHERTSAGWQQSVSVYPKLRLDPAWVKQRLGAAGLAVQLVTTRGGMVRLVARRGEGRTR